MLDTECFGKAVQVEIGAMMVGGVKFARENGSFTKGEEFGQFTLAGSTIVLLFDKEVRNNLKLNGPIAKSAGTGLEIPVKIGEKIATLIRHKTLIQ